MKKKKFHASTENRENDVSSHVFSLTTAKLSALFLCSILLLASNSTLGDPDPPRNPALQTTVNLASLQFLTDQDDGINCEAELFVLIEVAFGKGQPTVSKLLTRQIDMDGSGPWPSKPIEISMLAQNIECTPMEVPTCTVTAYEIDSGPNWLLDLFGAAVGAGVGALGGPLTAAGGAALGYLTTHGLAALNGNDLLSKGTDYEIYVTYFVTNLGWQEYCEPLKDIILDPTPPAPPESIPEPPIEFLVGFDDEFFRDRLIPAYTALADASETLEEKWSYDTMRVFGVDRYHEFGRSAKYAASCFDKLLDVLAEIDTLEGEQGDDISLTQEQLIANQKTARGAIVGVAYIVAAQAWSEAEVYEIPSEIISNAEFLMEQARALADSGDYVGCIELYKEATCMLLRELHPDFNTGPMDGDCNANGVLDAIDIYYNTSQDMDKNGIPDECRTRGPDRDSVSRSRVS
jgi:hypothetical protein